MKRNTPPAHHDLQIVAEDAVAGLPENPKPDTDNSTVGQQIGQLTTREIEVLQFVAKGKLNKQAASELRISIKTVEKHRDHLMEKLNIHEIAGLTRYAISTGIIECSVQVTIAECRPAGFRRSPVG